MISFVTLNGDSVFENERLDLSELTTVGALPRHTIYALRCKNIDILFGDRILRPSDVVTDVVKTADVLRAVVHDAPPHASTQCAFAFVLKDGSWAQWCNNMYKGLDGRSSQFESTCAQFESTWLG